MRGRATYLKYIRDNGLPKGLNLKYISLREYRKITITSCYIKDKENIKFDKKIKKFLRNYHNKEKSNVIVCSILKQHHDELKEDPEHLSCDFLKKIIGVDCK